jgi:hypothetical protein
LLHLATSAFLLSRSLKKQKEEDRCRVENNLMQPLLDSVTGLTFEQSQTIESVEQELSMQAYLEAEEKQRKRRETERYFMYYRSCSR